MPRRLRAHGDGARLAQPQRVMIHPMPRRPSPSRAARAIPSVTARHHLVLRSLSLEVVEGVRGAVMIRGITARTDIRPYHRRAIASVPARIVSAVADVAFGGVASVFGRAVRSIVTIGGGIVISVGCRVAVVSPLDAIAVVGYHPSMMMLLMLMLMVLCLLLRR